MDEQAWWAAVHGVAKSWTWLSDFPFTLHFHALEKEMATHSSVLAWRIPGTGESGGLPSMGSHRVRHDWSDLAAAAAAGSITFSVHLEGFLPRVLCLLVWGLSLAAGACAGSAVELTSLKQQPSTTDWQELVGNDPNSLVLPWGGQIWTVFGAVFHLVSSGTMFHLSTVATIYSPFIGFPFLPCWFHYSLSSVSWDHSKISSMNPILVSGLNLGELKGMATHTSILAWRIPWTEELGGLQSMGLQREITEWLT